MAKATMRPGAVQVSKAPAPAITATSSAVTRAVGVAAPAHFGAMVKMGKGAKTTQPC